VASRSPGVHDVRAEMVANVLSIQVSLGEVVTVGQQLLLLESMKMEIPVLSDVAGTISEIAVSPGVVIQEGDLLFRVS
jgi:acetyl-CoA carboxylase biotin carboxyl carrier protein